jgi:hypothetical protein
VPYQSASPAAQHSFTENGCSGAKIDRSYSRKVLMVGYEDSHRGIAKWHLVGTDLIHPTRLPA